MTKKRPRHYVAEILRERDIDKRRAMLASVPAHFRDLVELNVRNIFAREAARR